MNRPEKIDFFELSDTILERLNSEGNAKLTHYDISLKLCRDTNYPSDKFNIYLFVFDEEYSVAYYTEDCDTVTKIAKLLFVHAADDYGYADTKHGLIVTKIGSLHNRLRETIYKCEEIVSKKFESKSVSDLSIFVDEQHYDQVDEKGLPFFQLNVYSKEYNLNIRFPIDSNSADYYNQKEILAELEKVIYK